MADRWFLEKKGKFYGPFKAEKVLAYVESGKIGPDNLVAKHASGKDAQTFSNYEEEIRNPESAKPAPEPEPEPPPKEPSPPETAEVPEPNKEDEGDGGLSKEWYVATPERRFGPYSLGHLESLLEEGKLTADDRVQREGQSHLLPITDLFPDAGKKKAKPKPKKEKTKPSKNAKKAAAPAKPKSAAVKSGGSKKWVAAVAGLLIIGALVAGIVILKPFERTEDPREGSVPGQKVFAKIKSKYEQTSALRRQVVQAEMPPFNDLVTAALREGLTFNYQKIADLRVEDQELYVSDGPKNFGSWFPDKVRREHSYAMNEGYVYTYVSGYDGIIFAVIITHENFKKNILSTSKISDFAPNARRGNDFGMKTWKVSPTEGVEAIAVWKTDVNMDERLQYLCVIDAFEIK